jgi:ABC-type transporter Mla subunit MlaD
MVLATSYEIRVQKDSITEIETAGLLGDAYLSIDTSQASGAPVENYGYLKSKHTKSALSLGDQLRAADAALRLVEALKEAGKGVPKDSSPSTHPPSR